MEEQTVTKFTPPKETPENLLIEHQDVAESARKIAQFLVHEIALHVGNETEFFKLINKSDRASLTLQRLCSILRHLIPIEQNLMGKQLQLFPKSKKRDELSAQDFELILEAAKQFGLLKEGADEKVQDIISDLYLQQRTRERGILSKDVRDDDWSEEE